MEDTLLQKAQSTAFLWLAGIWAKLSAKVSSKPYPPGVYNCILKHPVPCLRHIESTCLCTISCIFSLFFCL